MGNLKGLANSSDYESKQTPLDKYILEFPVDMIGIDTLETIPSADLLGEEPST